MCDDYASLLHWGMMFCPWNTLATKLNLHVTQPMPECSLQISGVAVMEGAAAPRVDNAKGRKWVKEESPRALWRPPDVWLKRHSVHPPGLLSGKFLYQDLHVTFIQTFCLGSQWS